MSSCITRSHRIFEIKINVHQWFFPVQYFFCAISQIFIPKIQKDKTYDALLGQFKKVI